MESLLASYASSSDDEEDERQHHNDDSHQNPSRFLSSLPPPKSSPFLSLPPAKSLSRAVKPLSKQQEALEGADLRPNNDECLDKPSSSLFAVLPSPKTTQTDPSVLPNNPKPKKVVQFKPPVNPFFANSSNRVNEDDEDEDDEGEKEKQRKKNESFTQTPSVKSFLSSIPAPKNSTTLGVLGSGSARRSSTIDADVPVPNYSATSITQNEVPAVHSDTGYNQSQQADGSLDSSMEADYSNWGVQGYANHEGGNANEGASDYGPNGSYADYGGNYGTTYTSYEQCGQDWNNGSSSATDAPAITETAEVALRFPGKRGRKDAPQQIVEVSQDELMKNRPREDQSRLTGIAFGPSYQPVSSKGKPSKLLKRKHQIGTLYFDMKQKEMELTERRAKGMLTKAQTQGKYGW